MSHPASSPSYRQLMLLILLVGVGGLVGMVGLNRWTRKTVDKAELIAANNSAKASLSSNSADGVPPASNQPTTAALSNALNETIVNSTARPARSEPSIVLPRVRLEINTKKLDEECERFVERMINKLPRDPLALNLAAMYYSQVQKTLRANDLWERCVKLAPKDRIAYHNWSTNAIHRGESERALEILDKAKQHAVEDAELIYQRAVALANLARDAEAVELLSAFANSGSMTPNLWLQYGLSKIKLKDFEAARDALRIAEQAGLKVKPLINGLMTCAVRLKDKESAERYREQLDSMDDGQEQHGQAEFDMRTGDRMRGFVLGIIGEAIEVYRRARLLDEAEQAALRTVAIDPSQIQAFQLLAGVYKDKKDPANQMLVYERLAELQPGFLLHHLMQAKAADECGQVVRAEALLKFIIAAEPSDAASFAAMAEFLLGHNRPTEAIWYLQQALELDPSPAGYQMLAKAHRMNGASVLAAEALENAKQQAPLPRVQSKP